jgi:putative RecB family exonuclease
MAIPVPTRLSPSRVESFTSCPLAFRFSAIDKLPEAPTVPAARGSLVHRALELLFCEPPAGRTLPAGLAALRLAVGELDDDPEHALLGLDGDGEAQFVADAEAAVRRYFQLEDPRAITAIGLELRLSVEIDGLTMVGVIDRLDLDANGDLVVTDYKTGRPPSERHEQGRLGGVNFYAYLCQELFGRRPVAVQLLYLSDPPIVITARPTAQSVSFLPRRIGAVYGAVQKACDRGEFQPRTGPLCAWCGFKPWCPAFGGDPERAVVEAAARLQVAGGPVDVPPVPALA